jgi:lysophospholipase L1-like esterase
MMITSRQQQRRQSNGSSWYCSSCIVCSSFGVVLCAVVTLIVIVYSRYSLLRDDIDVGQQTLIDRIHSSFFSSNTKNITLQVLEENNHRNQHLPHQQESNIRKGYHPHEQKQQHDNYTIGTKNDLSSTSTTVNDKKQQRQRQRHQYYYNILAYGDSLTAGMVRAGSSIRSPYAPYLQDALRTIRSSGTKTNNNSTNDNIDVSVYYRGNPGWTATDMLQDLDDPDTGLQTFIEQYTQEEIDNSNHQKNYTIVILLVGTNDLGYQQNDVDTISNEIQQLHTNCLSLYNVNTTIVLSIPSSGYQYDNNKIRNQAIQINNQLQQYCINSQKQPPNNQHNSFKSSYYIEFPIDYIPNSTSWSKDTLHLSSNGYKLLGTLLAPVINTIITNVTTNNDNNKNN